MVKKVDAFFAELNATALLTDNDRKSLKGLFDGVKSGGTQKKMLEVAKNLRDLKLQESSPLFKRDPVKLESIKGIYQASFDLANEIKNNTTYERGGTELRVHLGVSTTLLPIFTPTDRQANIDKSVIRKRLSTLVSTLDKTK